MIKANGELGLIISASGSPSGTYANTTVMVRTRDGADSEYSLLDVDRYLPIEETASFRILMRQKYPALQIRQ